MDFEKRLDKLEESLFVRDRDPRFVTDEEISTRISQILAVGFRNVFGGDATREEIKEVMDELLAEYTISNGVTTCHENR